MPYETFQEQNVVGKYLQRDVDVLVWHFLPSHPDGSETKKKLRYFGSNPSLRISGISQCFLTGVQLHIFALDVKYLGKEVNRSFSIKCTSPEWRFQEYLVGLLQHHTYNDVW